MERRFQLTVIYTYRSLTRRSIIEIIDVFYSVVVKFIEFEEEKNWNISRSPLGVGLARDCRRWNYWENIFSTALFRIFWCFQIKSLHSNRQSQPFDEIPHLNKKFLRIDLEFNIGWWTNNDRSIDSTNQSNPSSLLSSIDSSEKFSNVARAK